MALVIKVMYLTFLLFREVSLYCCESCPLKRLPGMQVTWVQSLGREDPLEKEMATHSSTLAWRIPWREEPGGLQSRDLKESDTTERFHFHFPFHTLVK